MTARSSSSCSYNALRDPFYCDWFIRASTGSSRSWPTVKWLGSSIRLRLSSRI